MIRSLYYHIKESTKRTTTERTKKMSFQWLSFSFENGKNCQTVFLTIQKNSGNLSNLLPCIPWCLYEFHYNKTCEEQTDCRENQRIVECVYCESVADGSRWASDSSGNGELCSCADYKERKISSY